MSTLSLATLVGTSYFAVVKNDLNKKVGDESELLLKPHPTKEEPTHNANASFY